VRFGGGGGVGGAALGFAGVPRVGQLLAGRLEHVSERHPVASQELQLPATRDRRLDPHTGGADRPLLGDWGGSPPRQRAPDLHPPLWTKVSNYFYSNYYKMISPQTNNTMKHFSLFFKSILLVNKG